MSWRDAAADTGRTGNGGGALRGRDLAVMQNFGPTTIAEQNMTGLADKANQPEGGVKPRLGWTLGSRGAADMHEMAEPMDMMD